jgi:hypothetical protein
VPRFLNDFRKTRDWYRCRVRVRVSHTFIAEAPELPATSTKHGSGPLVPQQIWIDYRSGQKHRELEAERQASLENSSYAESGAPELSASSEVNNGDEQRWRGGRQVEDKATQTVQDQDEGYRWSCREQVPVSGGSRGHLRVRRREEAGGERGYLQSKRGES